MRYPLANQVAQLSTSEAIPLDDSETHIKQKEEEKQTVARGRAQNSSEKARHQAAQSGCKQGRIYGSSGVFDL